MNIMASGLIFEKISPLASYSTLVLFVNLCNDVAETLKFFLKHADI